jgi:dihydrofolate synthase/folylpolyglutamate synthase
MADKDARGLLQVFEEIMNSVVITRVASTSRGMPAEELGEIAAEVFGAERVRVAPRLDDAIDVAVALAEESGVGLPGVLITGSVVAVGEARTLLGSDDPTPASEVELDDDWDPDAADAGANESVDRGEWP